MMTCRSCVEPKLVSNECRSRMCSSRISTCLMNTRRSVNEKVFTVLEVALEPGHKVVVLEVLDELLARATLDILGRAQILLLQRLDIQWNANTANIAL